MFVIKYPQKQFLTGCDERMYITLTIYLIKKKTTSPKPFYQHHK